MMLIWEWLKELGSAALIDLPITFLGAFIAYAIGRLIFDWRKEKKYGGWIVRALDEDGEEITRREISPALAERILNDKNELSVFIKGIGSTRKIWLNADPVSDESIDSGLLAIGELKWKNHLKLSARTKNMDLNDGAYKRVLTLDYRHNPPEETEPFDQSASEQSSTASNPNE